MHLISVKEPKKITEEVYTTGRIEGVMDEQSLVLKGKNGLYILVGCSHPGVEKIIDTSKCYGNVLGLIGGFHGFDNFSILKNLDLICPCHCTQHKQELKAIYPMKYSECGVGKVILI
jgi:7,8-dihydropterin-6-yl-methyl-4-(beta-D-ribofuranosyl)aminobenzene 5'-phosphate synthase